MPPDVTPPPGHDDLETRMFRRGQNPVLRSGQQRGTIRQHMSSIGGVADSEGAHPVEPWQSARRLTPDERTLLPGVHPGVDVQRAIAAVGSRTAA